MEEIKMNLKITGRVFIFSLLTAVLFCGSLSDGSSISIGLNTPDSPLITFRIAFRTGSINDPEGKEGLNALTALTIGQGGTQDMTYEEISKKLYPWGASINAQYDKEITTFIGEVHRDHFDEFYAIYSELILNPRFDPEDFQRNKEILKNSIVSTLRSNNDEELGKQSLNFMLYEGHPYEHTEMGTESGLDAIELEDVTAFYQKNYTKENIMIGLAGGYPSGSLSRSENDFLAALPAGREEEMLPEPRQLQDIEVLLVDKESIATAISIGFPLDINRSDKDFYALMVANSYLGEHRTFNGRLMNNMRGLRGLNYGDYSYIENFIQDGGTTFPVPNVPRRQQFFSIWIRPVPHHNAYFALRQAIRELQMLVDDGISQEDFEETREFLINYSKLYVQTTSRRLGYAMDSKFYGTEFYIDKIQSELENLTRDEVNAAVKRHLQYKNLAVAIITPVAKRFRDDLLANETSQIQYNVRVSPEILEEDKEIINYRLAINRDRIRIIPVGEMFKK